MTQHKLLYFTVVNAAPMGSGQVCPADLDLATFLVVRMEARGPNHPPGYGINGNQSATGLQSLDEEYLEG